MLLSSIIFLLRLTFSHTILRHKRSRFISAAFVFGVCTFARVRCVHGLVPSEPVWFEPQACDFAMTRVFEHCEFEAVAAKASKAAPEDVMKRFYVPVIGTSKCKFMGTQNSEEKDLIAFNTKVRFKWELASPHIRGSVERALRCCFVCVICFCVAVCVESSRPRLVHASTGTSSGSRKPSSEHR